MWWSFYKWSINAGFSTAILVFTCFILQKERSCLLLNDFMFSCCFYVSLNNFCAVWVDISNRVRVKFLMSNQRTKLAYTMSLDGSPKGKTIYGQSSKTLFKQKWGIPKAKFHFWLDQIYLLLWKHKILLEVKTFQKTTSSGISTNTILQSQAQEFSANYVPLFFIITTHS